MTRNEPRPRELAPSRPTRLLHLWRFLGPRSGLARDGPGRIPPRRCLDDKPKTVNGAPPNAPATPLARSDSAGRLTSSARSVATFAIWPGIRSHAARQAASTSAPSGSSLTPDTSGPASIRCTSCVAAPTSVPKAASTPAISLSRSQRLTCTTSRASAGGGSDPDQKIPTPPHRCIEVRAGAAAGRPNHCSYCRVVNPGNT